MKPHWVIDWAATQECLSQVCKCKTCGKDPFDYAYGDKCFCGQPLDYTEEDCGDCPTCWARKLREKK